jgi:hypothetical protein
MTYLQLKSIINDAYAGFTYDYVKGEVIGSDDEYPNREVLFIKCIYKVLLNQNGDTSLDLLTKVNIQNSIRLLNKYGNKIIAIEYS